MAYLFEFGVLYNVLTLTYVDFGPLSFPFKIIYTINQAQVYQLTTLMCMFSSAIYQIW